MPSPPAGETAPSVVYRRQMQSRALDREMAGLAGRQYGIVSRVQLLQIGMSGSAIDRRIRAGRLHLLHPGIFAVGHRFVGRDGYWLAAVLHGGDRAVLSHRSAAELWGICRGRDHSQIDISVPRATRSSAGIRRHHVSHAPDEVTVRRKIPVTTLARTLFDVAAKLSAEAFEAALREAEYIHRFRLEELEALLESHPGRRGVTAIRACLWRLGRGPRGRTRSRFEVRFAALLATSDLPLPSLNTTLDLDGFKVEADCLWKDQRVVVELDGGRSHGTRVAFESDRERDRRLQAAGWRVIRVTWRQLDDPVSLLRDLRRLLGVETASTVT